MIVPLLRLVLGMESCSEVAELSCRVMSNRCRRLVDRYGRWMCCEHTICMLDWIVSIRCDNPVKCGDAGEHPVS